MDFGTKNQSKILRKNTIQDLLVRVVKLKNEEDPVPSDVLAKLGQRKNGQV
jgi:hypothetical protein